MKKQLLFGGVVGGVIVWLLMRNKCKPCPKCDGGGSAPKFPSVLIQTPPAPPAPTPPQTPVIPPPPPDIKTLPVLDKPVAGQTGLAFTGSRWGSW
jgi:hypothetical protein